MAFARPGFGSQGCGAGILTAKDRRKGLWSLANGPAGCRGGFEAGLPNVTFETHKTRTGTTALDVATPVPGPALAAKAAVQRICKPKVPL